MATAAAAAAAGSEAAARAAPTEVVPTLVATEVVGSAVLRAAAARGEVATAARAVPISVYCVALQVSRAVLSGTVWFSSTVERAQSILRSQHVSLEFQLFPVGRCVVDHAYSFLRSQHERLESHVVSGVQRLHPSHRCL